MAHFARLGAEVSPGVFVVDHVSVVDNAKLDPANESASGVARQRRIHGHDTDWQQTHYNANGDPAKGYNFAGVGHTWDSNRGAFIAPRPLDSWVLNEATMQWEAPVARPAGPGAWEWDEGLQLWFDSTGVMSKVDFVLKFSGAENERIKGSTDPQVVAARERLAEVTRVAPKHPDAVAYLDLLNAKGLLDHAARPAEILAVQ